TTLTQYWSRMRRHQQEVMLERTLELTPTGVVEHLHVESWSDTPLVLDLALDIEADFVDIFEVRGHKRRAPRNRVSEETHDGIRTLTYVAQDGVRSETRIDLDGLGGALRLAPRESLTRTVQIHFSTSLPAG